MKLPERGVRVIDILSVAVAAGALSYLAFAWWFRREGGLPPMSWPAALLVAIGAGALAVAGRSVRQTVAGRARRPLPALVAYRVLRLAQACMLAGAASVGVYLGYAAVAARDIDIPSVREGVIGALLLALAGALLSGAGAWVQAQCRIDPPHDDPSDESDSPSGS